MTVKFVIFSDIQQVRNRLSATTFYFVKLVFSNGFLRVK